MKYIKQILLALGLAKKIPFISLAEHKPLLGEMVVFVSILPHYTTDPWVGWLERDGSFTRWPHKFPPTHWVELPSAYAWRREILGERA